MRTMLTIAVILLIGSMCLINPAKPMFNGVAVMMGAIGFILLCVGIIYSNFEGVENEKNNSTICE